MREYVFKCNVSNFIIPLKVTVVAKDYGAAVKKMFNLVRYVSGYSVISIRTINMASPAEAEKYRKLS